MIQTIPQQGVIAVMPPATLEAALRRQDQEKAALPVPAEQQMDDLARYIRNEFELFKRHRDDAAAGWSQRLLTALRVFNGQYAPDKLAQIKQFGGSEVYARIIAVKCRGASSLLRDVYLAPDRPWGISPPADPDVPQEVMEQIKELVRSELMAMQEAGQEVPVDAIKGRVDGLVDEARRAEKKHAQRRAKVSEDRIQELLDDGGFYKALAEVIVDIPLFPFGCIKGPVVKIIPTVSWANGQPQIIQKPRLTWQRVSPFDLWWSPGVSDIEDAALIERVRYTRAELNDLLDLPGYNHEAIRAVLAQYGSKGFVESWDGTDTERAANEGRENPLFNRTGMFDCLEYHGNVQGSMLADFGIKVPDPVRDYAVQAWVIDRYVIKVQLSPSPRKRHPYFITSFEKVPGTPLGNGLPDILQDVEEVCNAALRALVNNLSISSGPQVVVNDDRIAPGSDAEELYPWKRWHTVSDPMGNTSEMPISFFQPNNNAQELLAVYQFFNNLADELSAIPKYQTGQGASGGAGRTAAGLAMLMGNASKMLQTVAANIDRDIFQPLLTALFDMIMLTDTTGILQGDESIRVMGVAVAVQRETQRSRQLEFLQITANPVDAQIMGPGGRAAVLRSVSQTIGLDGEKVVPSDEEVKMAMAAAAEQQAQQMGERGAQAQGAQQKSDVTKDMGPRVRIAGGAG